MKKLISDTYSISRSMWDIVLWVKSSKCSLTRTRISILRQMRSAIICGAFFLSKRTSSSSASIWENKNIFGASFLFLPLSLFISLYSRLGLRVCGAHTHRLHCLVAAANYFAINPARLDLAWATYVRWCSIANCVRRAHVAACRCAIGVCSGANRWDCWRLAVHCSA